MKKSVLCLAFFSLAGNVVNVNGSTDNANVSDETIVQVVEDVKAACAQIIYYLVHNAVTDAASIDGVSLYQKTKHVFSCKEMKRIMHLGLQCGSVDQLYEAAAQLARKCKDIDAVIVLHIAIQEERQAWYKRYALAIGSVLAVSSVGQQMLSMIDSSWFDEVGAWMPDLPWASK